MQSTLQHAFAHTYLLLSHQLDVSVATGDSHDFAKFTASIDIIDATSIELTHSHREALWFPAGSGRELGFANTH